jgi:iron complex transport system ATP-binding protein
VNRTNVSYDVTIGAEVRDLNVRIGGARIIKDASARFERDAITAVIGPNGSGKSTLLRAVCGLLDRNAVSGAVLVDGADPFAMAPRDRARRISLFPQTRPVPDLTALEMIRHGRYPYRNAFGSLTQQDRALVEAAAAEAGVTPFLHRKLNTLSGGERQRAYLAMMLAQGTGVLALDEPTAWLDVGAQLAVLDILSKRKNENDTVIIVMHDVPQAFSYADALVVLYDGCVCAAGRPDDPNVAEAVESAFGVSIRRINSHSDALYPYALYR